MFRVFTEVFHPDSTAGQRSGNLTAIRFPDKRLTELLSKFGGTSFNGGIYRILDPDDIPYWNELIQGAFPAFRGRIACFSMDWLGRVFAIDSSRLVDGNPGVLMFEPGTSEALEIPCDIETFHESELIQYREEALAESFYFQWLKSGGESPGATQCVGYKRPLFLGGSDTVDNLELCDLDVYWTIAAQLIQKTRGLPLGTAIGKITLG